MLEPGDAVVAAAVVDPTPRCWSPAKTASASALPSTNTDSQSRGGKGIITMKTGDKTGGVIGALTVRDSDEIMLITVGGQMVRTSVKDIREAGRNTWASNSWISIRATSSRPSRRSSARTRKIPRRKNPK